MKYEIMNILGTRAYMAPERFIRNKKIIPIKADVYSYGFT